MGAFARGYVRNPSGHRAPPARLLLGARPPAAWSELPVSVDLSEHFPEHTDQGPSSSCVGHGTAVAIAATFSAAAKPLSFVPSPLGIYAVARAITRAHDNPRGALPMLADEGAMPADAIAGIALWGVHPMGPRRSDGRYSDVDLGNVNAEPSLIEIEQDGIALIVGEHAVTTLLVSDRAFEVASLLAAGQVVVFGMVVDGAYERWIRGDAPISRTDERDPDGGGHWQALSGYTHSPGGGTVFRVRGSWGEGAGDGGDFLITDTMLAACDDVTAIRAKLGTRRA